MRPRQLGSAFAVVRWLCHGASRSAIRGSSLHHSALSTRRTTACIMRRGGGAGPAWDATPPPPPPKHPVSELEWDGNESIQLVRLVVASSSTISNSNHVINKESSAARDRLLPTNKIVEKGKRSRDGNVADVMYFRSHSLYYKPPLFRISRLHMHNALEARASPNSVRRTLRAIK